jgi:Ser-tRNA(Ala) deacylase AlaX
VKTKINENKQRYHNALRTCCKILQAKITKPFVHNETCGFHGLEDLGCGFLSKPYETAASIFGTENL